jgi:hypothetical protein
LQAWSLQHIMQLLQYKNSWLFVVEKGELLDLDHWVV